jgi:hypothetical protein
VKTTTPSKLKQKSRNRKKKKTTLNDAQRKADSLARKRHAEEKLNNAKPDQNRGSEDKKIKASFIREIKLTHSKNGCH